METGLKLDGKRSDFNIGRCQFSGTLATRRKKIFSFSKVKRESVKISRRNNWSFQIKGVALRLWFARSWTLPTDYHCSFLKQRSSGPWIVASFYHLPHLPEPSFLFYSSRTFVDCRAVVKPLFPSFCFPPFYLPGEAPNEFLKIFPFPSAIPFVKDAEKKVIHLVWGEKINGDTSAPDKNKRRMRKREEQNDCFQKRKTHDNRFHQSNEVGAILFQSEFLCKKVFSLISASLTLSTATTAKKKKNGSLIKIPYETENEKQKKIFLLVTRKQINMIIKKLRFDASFYFIQRNLRFFFFQNCD